MLDDWEQQELERILEEIASLSVGQKFIAPLPWAEIGEEPEVRYVLACCVDVIFETLELDYFTYPTQCAVMDTQSITVMFDDFSFKQHFSFDELILSATFTKNSESNITTGTHGPRRHSRQPVRQVIRQPRRVL